MSAPHSPHPCVASRPRFGCLEGPTGAYCDLSKYGYLSHDRWIRQLLPSILCIPVCCAQHHARWRASVDRLHIINNLTAKRTPKRTRYCAFDFSKWLMHLVMLSAALLVFSINIDLLSVRVDKLSVHNQYRKRSANPIPVHNYNRSQQSWSVHIYCVHPNSFSEA
jgi:hypothetical protein